MNKPLATGFVPHDRVVTHRILSYEDLPRLLNLLSDVVDKWEIIATFLPNMRKRSIAVVREMQADADIKFFEIMKRWLNETNPAPTVKDLVDTLKESYLSEHATARAIEKEFQHHKSSSKYASSWQFSLMSQTRNGISCQEYYGGVIACNKLSFTL